MRKSLRLSSLLLGTVLLSNLAQSQSDRFTYVITDVDKGGANWAYLRKLNLRDGSFSNVLLDGTNAKQVAFDASSKKEISSFAREAYLGYSFQPAFSSGVAAMAYDKKNNRIWYTPMFIDQLRYIDLKTLKVFYVTGGEFTGMTKKSADQGNIITRMAIGSDGNGYAMTNDGAHLIRFTTGKKTEVTDLGTLVDDPAGKGNSIHSSCTSFGGDMIADNDGNLYVFSARNHVFKVNIKTKVATHEGTISGLPATFTSNGAAVTEDNQIMISSAVDATNGYYIVDSKTWSATSFAVKDGWRSSDLANGNFLQISKPTTPAVTTLPLTRVIPKDKINGAASIQLFPNPVTNNQFAVQFHKLPLGEYTIQVTDVMGRQVVTRIVNVAGEEQIETVRLNAAAAKGFYLVKVLNKESMAVTSGKIIVQ